LSRKDYQKVYGGTNPKAEIEKEGGSAAMVKDQENRITTLLVLED